MSVSLEKLADFLSSRGLPGDAEQALAYYHRDLEISERLLAANPLITNPDYIRAGDVINIPPPNFPVPSPSGAAPSGSAPSASP